VSFGFFAFSLPVPLTSDAARYVSNLSEKLKREELRKLLYALFSSHGALLEVIALKTNKLRGQAFVVFKDIQAATKARRELNGFPFYGKPLRVTFARQRSHLVEKQEGTFDEEKAEALRKAREASAPASKRKAASAAAAAAAAPVAAAAAAAPAESEGTKRHKMDFQAPDENPNPILFVQNLPPESTELMVQMLFQQFPGYKSVRLVEGQGIAFVEFTDVTSSSVAKNALQSFKIKEQHLMMISFLKS
jgi:U2 small nuclear ribonucleoprotein B''